MDSLVFSFSSMTFPKTPAVPSLQLSIPATSSLPPSPTSVPVPPKRLRSCLSPSRQRPSGDGPFGPTDRAMSATSTMSTDEPALTCSSSPSPMTSRSASFSSQDGEGWRRARSVRWDASGSMDGGCIMTAYYSTWSADDYDRSPLEPPKPEERSCTMPARGSRCLSPLDCFTDEDRPAPGRDAFFPVSIPLAETARAFIPLTESICLSPTDEDESSGECEAEDREWEECMERRRMMFAQMCRPPGQPRDDSSDDSEGEHERRFEGYTSISASLVAMLASAGVGGAPTSGPDGGLTYTQHLAREAATPVGTPIEVEAFAVPHQEVLLDVAMESSGPILSGRPRLLRGAHRLRASFGPEDEVEEEDEEHLEDAVEDEEDEQENEEYAQPCAETVMAALRAFGVRPGRELRSGDEARDTE